MDKYIETILQACGHNTQASQHIAAANEHIARARIHNARAAALLALSKAAGK